LAALSILDEDWSALRFRRDATGVALVEALFDFLEQEEKNFNTDNVPQALALIEDIANKNGVILASYACSSTDSRRKWACIALGACNRTMTNGVVLVMTAACDQSAVVRYNATRSLAEWALDGMGRLKMSEGASLRVSFGEELCPFTYGSIRDAMYSREGESIYQRAD